MTKVSVARELLDAALDEPQPEIDENEEFTGEMSSIRNWLAECPEPGFLCGSE